MKFKKSQGHVEIILSFALFLGVILILFLFINPFSKTKETISIIDNIKKIIINNMSSEIGKLSIIVNETGDCYDFDNSKYTGNYREIQGDNRKFDIYFSNIFNDYAPNRIPGGCPLDKYRLGAYSKEKILIYEEIERFKDDYETRYENFKKELGITSDFAFDLRKPGESFLKNAFFPEDYVSYYKFDDNPLDGVLDSAGFNNGQCTSCPTQVTDRHGISEKAYEFDGLSDFLNLGTSNFNINQEITVSLWFKPISLGSEQVLIARGNQQPYEIKISSDKITASFNSAADLQQSSALISDRWYHIVFSYKENQFAGLYINGNLEASDILSGISNDPTKNTNIGRRELPAGQEAYFQGSIDDVMLYNRALSSEEAKNIYLKQKSSYITGSRKIPAGINVESIEFPVRIIDKKGEVQESLINIRAW